MTTPTASHTDTIDPLLPHHQIALIFITEALKAHYSGISLPQVIEAMSRTLAFLAAVGRRDDSTKLEARDALIDLVTHHYNTAFDSKEVTKIRATMTAQAR